MSELSFFGGYGPTQFLTLVSAGILMYAMYQLMCGESIALPDPESYPQQFYRNISKHIGGGKIPTGSIVSAMQKIPYVG